MVVFNIFIVSKSGGLIFNHDHTLLNSEREWTFTYPLDIKLKTENKKVVLHYGQKDGINGEWHLFLNSVLIFICLQLEMSLLV